MMKKALENIFIALIRLYQICISPIFIPCCRFHPTCSEYAILAIKQHGSLKGLLASLSRLLRCHPFHPGGYDPVK